MPEPQIVRQIVAERVRQWREERGLSQRQLVERMAGDWDHRTLSRVERAERNLDATELVAVALVLGIAPSALLVARHPVIIGRSVVDPSLFNMWLGGDARLVQDADGIVELSRPPGVMTTEEVMEQYPELFKDEG